MFEFFAEPRDLIPGGADFLLSPKYEVADVFHRLDGEIEIRLTEGGRLLWLSFHRSF